MIPSSLQQTENHFRTFGTTHIRPIKNLGKSDTFPDALWKKMAAEGLFKLGIDETFGGTSGNGSAIIRAGRGLTHGGGNIGMALSWMIPRLIARYFIAEVGSDDQKKQYLPKIADGTITPCFAVSEPDKGAHPKYLTTSAERRDNGFFLNGVKTFLTNGPIADLFIVIAITNTHKGKKEFSAFIIPRTCDGLSCTPAMDIPFFKPAPHGSMTLNNCRVPQNALLGELGNAYEKLVLPFRNIEDTIMKGPVTGAMAWQLEAVTHFIRKAGTEQTNDLLMTLGHLKSMVDTAFTLAESAGSLLDAGEDNDKTLSLHLYFRNLANRYQHDISDLVDSLKLPINDNFTIITHDLLSSAKIGAGVSKIKQMRTGNRVLNNRTDETPV